MSKCTSNSCKSQADGTFSFRWGVRLLDNGHTSIPNFMFDHYTEAGVTRREFLVVLHLARYQYETPGSECRPALATVARQMGYSVRGLQKVLTKLEERGLLVKHHRPGKPTIYDFRGFSRAVLTIALKGEPQFTHEPQFRGPMNPSSGVTHEPQFRGPMNPSSSEEEKKKKGQKKEATKQGDVVVASSDELNTIIAHLIDFGVSRGVAEQLAATCTLDQVQGWIAHAAAAESLGNPAGLVIARLRAGEMPPETSGRRSRHRYIEGKYGEYVEH